MSVAPDDGPRFPYGYARPPEGGPQGMGTMLTWDQMMTRATIYNLHPEVRRRFKALIHAAADVGVALGCGTAWRIQPANKPGFAQPGNSWHESCPVNPRSPTALAIDTVPNVSWMWLESQADKYGFRTFKYLKEPWHIQPTEISASRRWATTLPRLTVWDLPGDVVVTPPTPTPTPPQPTPTPPASGVFTVQGYRKDVRQGSQGKMAKMCQQQINLLAGQGVVEDGDFGSQSVAALKNVQTVLGVTADGWCGQKTWQAMENGIKTQADSGGWD